YRPAGDTDHLYWRIAHFLFPFYTMIPTGTLGEKSSVRAWVPMDDHHTMSFQIGYQKDSAEESRDFTESGQIAEFSERELLTNTHDWYGRFRIKQNAANDYLIDIPKKQRGESFTGLSSIPVEDQAVTESMGPIADRPGEHLGVS